MTDLGLKIKMIEASLENEEMKKGGKMKTKEVKTKTEEIKIENIFSSKTYELTLGDYSIRAKVDSEGITLNTHKGNIEFEFEDSDSETLEAIGELIKQASKLQSK